VNLGGKIFYSRCFLILPIVLSAENLVNILTLERVDMKQLILKPNLFHCRRIGSLFLLLSLMLTGCDGELASKSDQRGKAADSSGDEAATDEELAAELESQSLSTPPSPITGSWLGCSIVLTSLVSYDLICIIEGTASLKDFELVGWSVLYSFDDEKFESVNAIAERDSDGNLSSKISLDPALFGDAENVYLSAIVEFKYQDFDFLEKLKNSSVVPTGVAIGTTDFNEDGLVKLSLNALGTPPTIDFNVKDPVAASTAFSKIDIRYDLTNEGPVDCDSGALITTFLPTGATLAAEQSGMETQFSQELLKLLYDLDGLAEKVVTYKFCYYDPSGALLKFEVPISLKSESLKAKL